MRLSRSTEYAMQATLQIARSKTGNPIPCSQLAATSSMPERFLLQILRSLVEHGVLKSSRGVSGGYMLNRRPDEITLFNLVEAVEGPQIGRVPTGHVLSEYTQAKVRIALNNVAEATQRELSRLTLAQKCSKGFTVGIKKRPLPERIEQRPRVRLRRSIEKRRGMQSNVCQNGRCYCTSAWASFSTAAMAASSSAPLAKPWFAVTLPPLATMTVTSAAGLIP